MRYLGTFYVRYMSMYMAYSNDWIQQGHSLSIDCYTKYIRSAASARIKPGQSPCQGGCANHYTTRASRNEFSNVGAIEVGLHASQVPNSCRKWHTIYILVFIHNPLYMSDTTLRSVVNVSSFPPVPLQIEVWAVSNLTFALLSFAILHSTTEVPFTFLALYFSSIWNSKAC